MALFLASAIAPLPPGGQHLPLVIALTLLHVWFDACHLVVTVRPTLASGASGTAVPVPSVPDCACLACVRCVGVCVYVLPVWCTGNGMLILLLLLVRLAEARARWGLG